MAVRQWYGPLWILPAHTGGGVNVGSNILGGQAMESDEYAEAPKGLIVSAPTANSGDAYLLLRAADGTYKSTNAGTVICVIPKGSVIQIPQPGYGGNKLDLRQIGISAAASDLVYPTAIM